MHTYTSPATHPKQEPWCEYHLCWATACQAPVGLAVTYGGSTCAEQRAPVSRAKLAGVGGNIVVLGDQEVERGGSSRGELKRKSSAVRGRRP